MNTPAEENVLNPGEKVNRPRYTIDPLMYCALVLALNWWISDINSEMAFMIDYTLPLIDFNTAVSFLSLMHVLGADVGFCMKVEHLRVKASDIYDKFLARSKLEYLGKHAINLVDPGGVLHPVDHFLKHIYDRYFPSECAEAFVTYKRTNPTLPLRLDHLEKFAEPNTPTVPKDELLHELDCFVKELANEEGFSQLCHSIKSSVEGRLFDDVQIDESSAAGFPFRQGLKKRDVRFQALQAAHEMLDDPSLFDDYMQSHVWYTTGRARMQAVDAEPAGRLIIYAGYSYLLMSMLFLQPWSRFMNRTYRWCGVGFSWMHAGADSFAEYFEAEKGFAPKGYRYVSLDISGWDTKLHPDVMDILPGFYKGLLSASGIHPTFISRAVAMVEGMIRCVILMPLGHAFFVKQGMKSGWGATANDNTLLHELIFRCVMRRLKPMKHVLYGDDNFMLVPDDVSDESIRDEYSRFGLKIKVIHASRCLADVDFLSKYVTYCEGHYYPFRAAVETHSRILMPEELDPRRRTRPDPVIAVERVLGHLLDNPFNSGVRDVCYKILERLRMHYHIDYIEVHDDILKKHPWRSFDKTLIPRKFPTVPSMAFIEELYGVPIPDRLRVVWPAFPVLIRLDPLLQAVDSGYFDAAAGFAEDIAVKMSTLANKRTKVLVRKLSPYAQPKMCYGFHAARFEFAVNFFRIEFNNMLDLGSHPGACAASALKYCSQVVCVSKKPDPDGVFCPYIARGSSVTTVEIDADHYVPHRPFDLQHDDVDIVGVRTREEDISIGLGMLRRARANRAMVEASLLTVKEVDWRVKEAIYETYKDFGYVDMVKPLYSNPWKPEFMVLFRKVKGPRMRRSVFMKMLNGFLNSLAPQLFRWNDLMASALSGFSGVGDVPKCPFQADIEKDWIRPWGDGMVRISKG